MESRVAAARVLHRFGFGPSGTDFQHAVAVGSGTAIADMFSAINTVNARVDAAKTPPPQLEYINYATAVSRAAAETQRRAQERELKLWWLDRMTTSRQPLLERMTWFWHGHWATSQIKVRDARLMLAQNQTLRTHALGNFTAQAEQMLQDPAMLIWLDSKGNKKGRPNENLGREFLELFTLGEGHYTETDVREASRALTGWQLDIVNGSAFRNNSNFDSGVKTILGTTAGFDVASLATFITQQPQCANFISARLWRHFGSDTPLTDVALAPYRVTFGATQDIAELVRNMLNAIAVTDEALPHAKSPVDWLVSSMRALGTRPLALSDKVQTGILSDITAMGQLPFFPPNVSGWPSGRAWFTATSTQARMQCTQRLVTEAPKWIAKATPKQRPTLLADHLGVPAWTAPTQQALVDPLVSAKDAVIIALNSPDYLVGA